MIYNEIKDRSWNNYEDFEVEIKKIGLKKGIILRIK